MDYDYIRNAVHYNLNIKPLLDKKNNKEQNEPSKTEIIITTIVFFVCTGLTIWICAWLWQ